MYENYADMLVADHINHFSPASLYTLFHKLGFKKIEVDVKSHNAAIIVKASQFSQIPNKVSSQISNFSLNEHLINAKK